MPKAGKGARAEHCMEVFLSDARPQRARERYALHGKTLTHKSSFFRRANPCCRKLGLAGILNASDSSSRMRKRCSSTLFAECLVAPEVLEETMPRVTEVFGSFPVWPFVLFQTHVSTKAALTAAVTACRHLPGTRGAIRDVSGSGFHWESYPMHVVSRL